METAGLVLFGFAGLLLFVGLMFMLSHLRTHSMNEVTASSKTSVFCNVLACLFALAACIVFLNT